MKKTMMRSMAAGATLYHCSTLANAAIYTLDVSGIESWDAIDSPNNVAFTIDLADELGFGSGTALVVDAIGFDVTIDAESPLGTSWLSEATVGFESSDFSDGVFLSPGVGDDFTGTASYSSGGLIDLVSLGLDVSLADGLLIVQFFEGFDDVADAVDAIWTDGFIEISAVQAIPLPAAVWLLAGGLLALGGIRRKA